jgi:hypothetical protein
MQSTKRNILSKIVKEVINKLPLCEAYNNLTKREFDSDMAKMGFIVRNGEGSRFIYIQPQYHAQVTVHWHGGTMKASTLVHVKNELKRVGWFNDPKNLKIFPFQKWKFNPSEVAPKEEQQIPTNSPYENAETIKIFYDSPICVLKFNNQYNLCQDEQNKTPLLQSWFDDYGYDDKTNSIPCLKKLTQDMQIEAYPISQDGALKEPIIETKLNNMQKIRLTESQLQNIIKEAVNEISASLANRAASKAYQQAREGFGQYPNGEIPFDSPHGKKFQQGEKFLKYRNNKLGIDKGNMIYYPNGDGSAIQLRDKNMKPLTEPTDSFEDMESQYNNSMRESISRIVKKSINEMFTQNQ